MSIKIGSNLASINAQRRLGDATSSLSSIYEKLSSGQRINKASDDAASLSIASALKVDSRIYTQAIRNVNDGVSMLGIAESGLASLQNISIRHRELATQAANGTFTNTQRRALDKEANALVEEFNRIVVSTKFNNLNLLEGGSDPVRIQAGVGTSASLSVDISSSLQRGVGDGTFTYSTLSTGVSPSSIASGDFNADGKNDLVVVGGSSGTTANIYLGNGSGGFTLASSPTVGSTPNLVTTGDINNDGKTDIVVSDYGDGSSTSATVLISQGDGNFTSSTVANASGATGIQLADVNNDKQVDLLSISSFSPGTSEITSISLGATTQQVFVSSPVGWSANNGDAYGYYGYSNNTSGSHTEQGNNYMPGTGESTTVTTVGGSSINQITTSGTQEYTNFTATDASNINAVNGGIQESTVFYASSGIGTTPGSYLTFYTPGGQYYAWFYNTDTSQGSDPSPGGTGIQVNINDSMSDSDVASAIQSAVQSAAPVSVSTSSSQFTITNNSGGAVSDASGYGFSGVSTQGTTTDNNDYFSFSATNGNYYVWFNVGGIGTDPSLGGTGIQVSLNSYDSSSTVASNIAAAIRSSMAHVSSYDSSGTFYIQNNNSGNVTDASGWGSPSITSQGSDPSYNADYFTFDSGSGSYYVWFLRDSAYGSDPGISGRTGIQININSIDSEGTVANNLASVLSSYGLNTSTNGGNQLYLVNTSDGDQSDATGWGSPSVTTQGSNGYYDTVYVNDYYTENNYSTSDNYSSNYLTFTTTSGDKYFYFNDNNPNQSGTGINVNNSANLFTSQSGSSYNRTGSYPNYDDYYTYDYSISSFSTDNSSQVASNVVNALYANGISTTDNGNGTIIINDAGYFQAESLIANKYFNLYDGTNQYYVWYNVDGGGSDPAPGGTAIQVAITASDDATSVATKTAAAINSAQGSIFSAGSSGADLTITRIGSGTATDSSDGNLGWTINTSQQGALGTAGGGAGTVLLGNGNGTFGTQENFDMSGAGLGFKTADFNADGKLDIVGANDSDDNISVLLGNGDGTFGAATKFNVGSTPKAVSVGDFNADGFVDVAAANSGGGTVSILLGKGNGSFNSAVSYAAGSSPYDVISADMNGDGRTDLVTSDFSSGAIGVLYSNGNGTFQSIQTKSVGAGTRQAVAADFNGDGAMDLATADSSTSTAGLLLAGATQVTSMQYLDLNTRTSALASMSIIEDNFSRISKQIGDIGMAQSRLSITLNILASSRETANAAESRIMSADMADEAASLIKTQILQKAATSVLAQANQAPSLAAQLLRSIGK
jgi:flagellin-like hook-associated protein FlgL